MKLIKFGLIICGVLLFGMAKGQDVSTFIDEETVNAEKPTITEQPQSYAVTLSKTETQLLSVTASVTDGGTLTYQWYKSEDGTTETNEIIEGEIVSTFKAPIDKAGIFYYFVEVTNTIHENYDGGGKVASIKSDVITMTVNAQKYTIFASAGNGGSIKPNDSVEVEYGDTMMFTFTPDSCYKLDAVLVNNEPTTDYIEEEGMYSYTFENVQCNDTIRISFKIKTFTVKFNSNGGSNVDSITVNCDKKVSKPKDPVSYDCKSFDGWYTDNETFKNKWNFETNTVTQDTTLFVKWKSEEALTKIVRKKNSNILICKNVLGVVYRWGSYEKSKGEQSSQTLSGENVFTYFQFAPIDTAQFVYYVEIRYIGDRCWFRKKYDPLTDDSYNLQSSKVAAYPNPSKGNFSVVLGDEVEGMAVIYLQNISGQIIMSKQITDYKVGDVLQFDLNISAGIYLLVVKTAEEVLTSKVVIE